MKHNLHAVPSFAVCARDGYFFCLDCRHVVQRLEHAAFAGGVCAECGSHRLRWNAPVFSTMSEAGRFIVSRPGIQMAD